MHCHWGKHAMPIHVGLLLLLWSSAAAWLFLGWVSCEVWMSGLKCMFRKHSGVVSEREGLEGGAPAMTVPVQSSMT